jgi:hypothetical protein
MPGEQLQAQRRERFEHAGRSRMIGGREGLAGDDHRAAGALAPKHHGAFRPTDVETEKVAHTRLHATGTAHGNAALKLLRGEDCIDGWSLRGREERRNAVCIRPNQDSRGGAEIQPPTFSAPLRLGASRGIEAMILRALLGRPTIAAISAEPPLPIGYLLGGMATATGLRYAPQSGARS